MVARSAVMKRYHAVGFDLDTGFDLFDCVLVNSRSYIPDVPDGDLDSLRQQGRLTATTNFEELAV